MTPNKNRGWLHVLALIIPYLIIVGLFQFVGILLADVDFTDPEHFQTPVQQLVVTAFDLMGTFLVLGLFMKFVDKLKFIKLGFQTLGRGKEFIVGLVIGLVIMFLGYISLLFAGEIHFLKTNVDVVNILLTTVFFTGVAIVEEVLFRGYVLRNLMISFNAYVALVVSAALFSFMHAFNPNVDWFALLDIFMAGILLGLSYIHTKNLWFPIALHLSWNLFQSYFGFNVSGQDFYSIVEFTVSESDIWNGGAFGFEGSLLSIGFQVVTIAGIFWYYDRKKTGHFR